jgi:hypothetical protein
MIIYLRFTNIKKKYAMVVEEKRNEKEYRAGVGL